MIINIGITIKDFNEEHCKMILDAYKAAGFGIWTSMEPKFVAIVVQENLKKGKDMEFKPEALENKLVFSPKHVGKEQYVAVAVYPNENDDLKAMKTFEDNIRKIFKVK